MCVWWSPDLLIRRGRAGKRCLNLSIKKISRIDFEEEFAISRVRFLFLSRAITMDKVKGTTGIRLIMFHDFLTIARLAEYLADYNFLRQISSLSLSLFFFLSSLFLTVGTQKWMTITLSNIKIFLGVERPRIMDAEENIPDMSADMLRVEMSSRNCVITE